MSRNIDEAISEATKALSKHFGDSEAYHSTFDDLLEERLQELDPDFMSAMNKLYADSGEARWCA